MNELIKIEVTENQEPAISGRELHEFLEVATPYDKWFSRMVEYGFTEGTDFSTFLSESTGGRPAVNHLLKIDMAKELAMIQRTEKGKQARQYFIQIEKDYNRPEKIMARALVIAERELSNLQIENKIKEEKIETLTLENKELSKKIEKHNRLTSMEDFAEELGTTDTMLYSFLNVIGVIYFVAGDWNFHSPYRYRGFAELRTTDYRDKEGRIKCGLRIFWTEEGKDFVKRLINQYKM